MENFYFLFFVFFTEIYSQIKDGIKFNPIFIDNGGYPIVLSTLDNDTYYYVLTEKKDLKIEKETGNVCDSNDAILISSNNIYITDKSNKNYILYNTNESNEWFKIIYNPFISTEKINLDYLNFIENKETKIIGNIGKNDDFIIYGYYKEKLFFSNISHQSYSYYSIGVTINDKLTCKLIEGEYFICAMIINNELIIHFLRYTTRKY